jgi:hypothetical protein
MSLSLLMPQPLVLSTETAVNSIAAPANRFGLNVHGD